MKVHPTIVIGIVIVLSAGGRAGAQPAGGPGPNRYALLVGCTRYPNLPEERWLAGPGNDVVLMRTLLTGRYQSPAANIVTLADGGDPALRPTRARIQQEFDRLKEIARPG